MAAGSQILVLDGNGQVFREGEFPKEDSIYPRRTVIRVLGEDGKPVAGTPVQWTVPPFAGRWREGELSEEGGMVTVTNENGESSNAYTAPNYVSLGQSYFQTEAKVSALGVSAPVHFTVIVLQVDGFPNPFPNAQRLSPSGDPPVIAAAAGDVVPGGVRYQFSVAGRLGNGAPLANVGLSVTTRNKPEEGPVVECAQAPIVLSGVDGVATCDLKVSGKAGAAALYLLLGGGYSVGNEPFLVLNVTPANATRLRVAGGNHQTASPNGALGQPLAVVLDDGLGNGLGGATIKWDVTEGWATLGQTATLTDATGRSTNNLRLGQESSTVTVRATALTGSQPAATFTVQIADPRSPRVLFRDTTGELAVLDRATGQVFPGDGAVAGDPAGATNAYGNTFITTRDPAGALWLRVFLTDRTWGPWLKAGGEFEGSPALAVNANGSPLLIGRNKAGAYLAKTYAGFPGFSSWIQFGGNFASDPVVAAVGNTYYVAGRDKAGAISVASYTMGGKVEWRELGGKFSGKPSIAAGPNGPVVAARDASGVVSVYWGASWTKLEGKATSDPQLAGNTSATAYLAVHDATTHIAWMPLTLGPTALTAGVWTSLTHEMPEFGPFLWGGRLHFFARSKDGDLFTGSAASAEWDNLGLARWIASTPQVARF